ncbi:hypothetical protein LXL04_019979 [Taraxacum kok-saghyz]
MAKGEKGETASTLPSSPEIQKGWGERARERVSNVECRWFKASGIDVLVGEQLGIFALPGKLWSALGTPSNFHNGDSTSFQPLDFSVHDLNWFLHEIEFFVDLYFFQRNNECLIRQALLEA